MNKPLSATTVLIAALALFGCGQSATEAAPAQAPAASSSAAASSTPAQAKPAASAETIVSPVIKGSKTDELRRRRAAMREGQVVAPTSIGTLGGTQGDDKASAADAAPYLIPPFQASGVALCDLYATEARRCLNEYEPKNRMRQSMETRIKALLKAVKPEPSAPVNEWRLADCRRGLDVLAMRFKQCGVQKQP